MTPPRTRARTFRKPVVRGEATAQQVRSMYAVFDEPAPDTRGGYDAGYAAGYEAGKAQADYLSSVWPEQASDLRRALRNVLADLNEMAPEDEA
jgi:hypothetical protein